MSDDKRKRIDEFFVPENEKESAEHQSPSGLYRLQVTLFDTKPGAWQYTRGLGFRQGESQPIFEVRRNYSYFPFLWIEDHPNGHHYLLCGQDYQGQTVLELDTGKRRDAMSPGSDKGNGFCWASYVFDPRSQLLLVSGCYWADIYQYFFFDFSDPINGWLRLETDDELFCDNFREPTFEPDGTIKYYQSEVDPEDEKGADELPVIATKTFKREGLKLVMIDQWQAPQKAK